MKAAKVVAHCTKCKRAYVHIAWDGIDCRYDECDGELRYDDTPEAQADRREQEQRVLASGGRENYLRA